MINNNERVRVYVNTYVDVSVCQRTPPFFEQSSKSTCKLVPGVPGFASAKLDTIFHRKQNRNQNLQGLKPFETN